MKWSQSEFREQMRWAGTWAREYLGLFGALGLVVAAWSLLYGVFELAVWSYRLCDRWLGEETCAGVGALVGIVALPVLFVFVSVVAELVKSLLEWSGWIARRSHSRPGLWERLLAGKWW